MSQETCFLMNFILAIKLSGLLPRIWVLDNVKSKNKFMGIINSYEKNIDEKIKITFSSENNLISGHYDFELFKT